MLFFNYQNLFFLAGSDCQKIVKLILLQEKHPIPELHGRNYIRNLEPIKDNQYSFRERAEYIGFCSYRTHPVEMFYRKNWLEIADMPPWIPREVIQSNPLITIKNNQIHFPFEV